MISVYLKSSLRRGLAFGDLVLQEQDNCISVLLWMTILWGHKTGVPGENNWPITCRCQSLSHKDCFPVKLAMGWNWTCNLSNKHIKCNFEMKCENYEQIMNWSHYCQLSCLLTFNIFCHSSNKFLNKYQQQIIKYIDNIKIQNSSRLSQHLFTLIHKQIRPSIWLKSLINYYMKNFYNKLNICHSLSYFF